MKNFILFLMLLFFNSMLFAQTPGSIDTSFNPTDPGFGKGDGASNAITASAIQADGKTIIVGGFTTYNGTTVNRIARINIDGTLDTTFTSGAGVNSSISAMAIQADGKIIIGGSFTTYNGTAQNYIARLNTDGTLDTSFTISTGPNAAVYAIAIQTDGKIIIGGSFTAYNGTTASRIVRLNTDGTLDTTFISGTAADNSVMVIAIQADGKIVIGGYFTIYNGVTQNYIARLNTDGTLDATFISGTGASNLVVSIAIQVDGKILIGGSFTTYNGIAQNYISRLNTDGTIDTTFVSGTGANTTVYAIEIQADGKIIIGGGFTAYNGTTAIRIARLNSDGTLDGTFTIGTGANSVIYTTVFQADGKIIIGGNFSTYNGITAPRIARLNTNGMLDATYNLGTGANNTVAAMVVQADGKTIIGGSFIAYNGTNQNYLARLNTDGTLDTTFAIGSGPNLAINAIAIQADGKIVIAGNFTSYNGTTRNRIARLNTDGSLDTTFTIGSGTNGVVIAIAIQTDGKIIIGGSFIFYNNTARNRIARLNTDGTLDTTFAIGTGANNTVTAIAIQTDGKIIIGGAFTTYNGTSVLRTARLNIDGTLDTTFISGANNAVTKIAIQTDGKIIISGTFTAYSLLTANRIARINTDGTLDTTFAIGSGINGLVNALAIQSDGKIIIGGTFTSYNSIPANHIAQLNTNGTLDTTFVTGTGPNNTVGAIAIQNDWKILIGGLFTAYNAIGRNRVARLFASIPEPTAAAQAFCTGATVADLVATGTALQWYDVASGGSALVSTDALATGTYYVTQTLSTRESARTPVAVTIGTTTTWDGSIWDNGVPTSTSKAIIAGNFTATADLSACSLDITGTAIVSVPTGFNFNVSGAVTVENTASLTFENNANLIQQATTNTNTGNVVVKRNSSALQRLDYTLWSSPVANQKLLDFSPDTNTSRFYTYNTTTNFYNAVASPSTTNFGTADGYLIRMPNNHPATPTIWNGVFSGVPNNGTINYTMTDGGAGFRFNLVGNPYPSPINMAQFVTDNTTITGTLYFWRKTNNPISPSCCTWTAGTFTTNGEAQVADPNGVIQTGQGFFVEANGTSTALTFKNTQRIPNSTGQFFKIKQTVDKNRIWLNARNTAGAFSQMAVGYITDATQGVDTFDGKYYNDGAIALSSIIDNNDYAIQGRALPFNPADIVPLGFSATVAGDYTIAIDHLDGLFLGSQSILLVDKLTGTETDLKAGAYTFTAATGADKTRFSLKYQKTLGISNPTFDENSVTVYKNKGTIQIISTAVTIANVKIFDIQGRLLFEKSKVNAKETSIENSKFANQVLIVRITGEDNAIVNKKVVN